MINHVLHGKRAGKAKLAAAVALATLLAGCGSDGDTSSSAGGVDSSAPNTSSSSSAPATTSSAATSSSAATTSSVASTSSAASSSDGGSSNVEPQHYDNVFAEVDNWYLNQWWVDNASQTADGAKIAGHSTGVWMDRIGAIEEIAPGEVISPAEAAELNNPGLEALAAGQGPNEGFGLREHLEAAREQGGALFSFVSYDLPGRDCAAVASNGELPGSELGMQIYREHYVDRIYNILADFPDIPVAVVIEIDSLPNLVTNHQDAPCQAINNTTSYGYVNGVRYSINKYSQLDNVHIYVDAGHSGWLGWDDDLRLATLFLHGTIAGFEGLESQAATIGDEIEAADGATGKYIGIGASFVEPPRFDGDGDAAPGYDKIDGFITNTSNYTPLDEPFLGDPEGGTPAAPLKSAYFYDWNPRFDEHTFTEDWLAGLAEHGGQTSGLGMLIDTGRNGWGTAMSRLQGGGTTEDPDQVDDYRVDQREHRGNWCNQKYAGVGQRPQANPRPWVDAYVWIKPQGESDGISVPEGDPRFVVDENDKNKTHDPMCDPNEFSTYGLAAESTASMMLGTSAMGDGEFGEDFAPHAGRWFQEQFDMLVDNAWPPVCSPEGEQQGDICD